MFIQFAAVLLLRISKSSFSSRIKVKTLGTSKDLTKAPELIILNVYFSSFDVMCFESFKIFKSIHNKRYFKALDYVVSIHRLFLTQFARFFFKSSYGKFIVAFSPLFIYLF